MCICGSWENINYYEKKLLSSQFDRIASNREKKYGKEKKKKNRMCAHVSLGKNAEIRSPNVGITQACTHMVAPEKYPTPLLSWRTN